VSHTVAPSSASFHPKKSGSVFVGRNASPFDAPVDIAKLWNPCQSANNFPVAASKTAAVPWPKSPSLVVARSLAPSELTWSDRKVTRVGITRRSRRSAAAS
jgi:hypothetical protein